MMSARRGRSDLPTLHRAGRPHAVLQAKLDEAVASLLPGWSREIRDLASRFLRDRASHAETLRNMRRSPGILLYRLIENDKRTGVEETERDLLKAGIPPETVERLKGLYSLADDVQREARAESDLIREHGCYKCRHCLASWERSKGAWSRGTARGELCDLYGEVPAFCFDFTISNLCADCGSPVDAAKVARPDAITPQCEHCRTMMMRSSGLEPPP